MQADWAVQKRSDRDWTGLEFYKPPVANRIVVYFDRDKLPRWSLLKDYEKRVSERNQEMKAMEAELREEAAAMKNNTGKVYNSQV